MVIIDTIMRWGGLAGGGGGWVRLCVMQLSVTLDSLLDLKELSLILLHIGVCIHLYVWRSKAKRTQMLRHVI